MLMLPQRLVTIGKRGMSIIGFTIAFIICFKNYRLKELNKVYLIYLMGVTITNILGDIRWIYILEILKLNDAPGSDISSLFYMTGNLFLTLAVFSIVRKKFSKWNKVRLVMEASILGIIFCYLIIPIFFNYFKDMLHHLNDDIIIYFVQLFYIFTDVLTIFGALLIFTFDKKFLSDFSGKAIMFGYFLWTFSDIFYVYLDINNVYIDNRVIGVLWPLAIIILSIFPVPTSEKIEIEEEINHYRNVDIIYLGIILSALLLNYYNKSVPLIIITSFVAIRFIMAKQLKVYEENEILTQKYKESNEQLYKLANIDSLTKIFNRRKLIEELEALCMKNDLKIKCALFFIDVDRFKSINDWYGHEIGDQILTGVAERLRSHIRGTDIIARQGGDEFVIVLYDVQEDMDLQKKLKDILSSFKEPFSFGEKTIFTSISIGGAIFPDDSDQYHTLMKYADISLYEAKMAGKNRAIMYNDKMEREANRKLEIESRLYESLDKNELKVYYQPQIDTITKKIIGVEALARWINSDLGPVGPGEFIPIAEENGFIIDIGDFILEKATTDIKYLNIKYDLDLKVGVNVSPKQFHTSELTYKIEKIIKEKDLKPHWLDVEITENLTMNHEEKVIEKLKKLKEIGVKISIDDFGTGYSSLVYLKNLPIDTLKIALEFVRGIAKNPQDYKIVKAIMAMCEELEIRTIAEGVEDEEQLHILRNLNCDQLQGYYFSKPISLSELEEQFKTTDRYSLKNSKKDGDLWDEASLIS